VSMLSREVEGVRDVTLSLPRVVGRAGISGHLLPDLDAAEHAALGRSATLLRETAAALSL
jgi:L-lactate dehydrogenase